MFVSKKGDVLILDGGSYQVIDQIEHKGKEYILLMSITGDLGELFAHKAPIHVAQEIVSEDSQELLVDFIEDEQIIKEIKNLYVI